MNIAIFQVDAFTDEPFTGNPAAVCVLPAPLEDRWMQRVAMEMNLSETAFLQEESDGFRLRWFTPKVEVDLCGHATLASAHVLWQAGYLSPQEEARFNTRSGRLIAVRQGAWIEIDLPAAPQARADAPAGLGEALGVKPQYVGRSRYDYLVVVDSETTLRDLKPDIAQLTTLPVRGVIVTSVAATPRFDFVCRFFAPALGIDEDPVTGSAHCCLGPFWAKRLEKHELTAYQASPRGGVVRVRVAGDRTLLGGKAVTVLRGQLEI